MSWPVESLGDLCHIEIGRTPARNQARYWGAGSPWLSIADMNGKKHVSTTKEQITTEAVRECRCRQVQPGTVLMSFKLSLGKVAMAACPIYTNEAIAALPIKNAAKLCPEYLYWALQQIDFTLGQDRAAKGLTLNKPKLAALKIPVPPLEEQRRIAAMLDKAEELCAKRHAAIALLDQLPQAIFLEMFGDPTTNPMGWQKLPFREIANTRLGKMLDQKKQSAEAPLPYLGNANVQWFRFDLRNVPRMTFSDKERSILQLAPGDVLICEGGEPGRSAVWTGELEECYFQKAIHRARVDQRKVLPQFVAHCLFNLVIGGGLKDHVTVATIAHLTGEKLATLPFLLPPIDLQHRFETRVEAIQRAKAAHQSAMTKFDELFTALQARAFTAGDLRSHG